MKILGILKPNVIVIQVDEKLFWKFYEFQSFQEYCHNLDLVVEILGILVDTHITDWVDEKLFWKFYEFYDSMNSKDV